MVYLYTAYKNIFYVVPFSKHYVKGRQTCVDFSQEAATAVVDAKARCEKNYSDLLQDI